MKLIEDLLRAIDRVNKDEPSLSVEFDDTTGTVKVSRDGELKETLAWTFFLGQEEDEMVGSIIEASQIERPDTDDSEAPEEPPEDPPVQDGDVPIFGTY